MKRVLFIHDAVCDLQTDRALAMLRQGLAGDVQLQSYGVSRGVGEGLGALARVRRTSREADLIHVWGLRTLRIAAFVSHRPILYTPVPTDGRAAVRWVLSAGSRRVIRLVCASAADQRHFVEQGVPAAHAMVVRPGVRMASPAAGGASEAIRRELGLGAHEKVVLAVGESEPHANHVDVLRAVATLHFFDPRYRLLISGIGGQSPFLHRLQETWKTACMVDAHRVLRREVDYEELVAAADVALCAAKARTTLWPILACMAGGVPLVAPATHATSDLLEDHHTALLVTEPKVRLMSQRILTLVERQELAKKLADQARAEAYELFSVSRYVSDMRAVYASL